MNGRVLKTFVWVLALSLVLGLGVVASSKIARATQQAQEPGGETPEPGIVIASVAPNSPAAKAGVVRGDILLQIDGQAVNNRAELTRYLSKLEPKAEVELEVLHGDEERTLTASLDGGEADPYLGITPCGCGDWLSMSDWDIGPVLQGAVVVEVVPDSPADQAGLEEGDVIVAVDGHELGPDNDLADLVGAHQPGDRVTLTVRKSNQDEELDLELTLAEHPEQMGVAFLGVSYLPTLKIHRFEGQEEPFGMPNLDEWSFGDGLFFGSPDLDLEGGALVLNVVEDSPAAAADLQFGDVITAVDGEPVESPDALTEAITSHEPGERVTLTVRRFDEDEALQIEVTLAEHPDEEGVAYLGVQLGPSPSIQMFRQGPGFFDAEPFSGAQTLAGIVVREVQENSPADEAGLQVGDVITAIDGEPISDPQALAEAVTARQPGDRISLTVLANDQTDARQVEITLGEHPDKEGGAYLGVSIGVGFRQYRFGGRGRRPEIEPFFPWGDFEFNFEDWPFGPHPQPMPGMPPGDVDGRGTDVYDDSA